MNELLSQKRICITGGAGFLGKVVTRKLMERGVTEIFIPTIENYDLVNPASIDQMLNDFKSGCHHPSCRPCGWNRCK